MNYIDIIIIIVTAYLALKYYKRGFIRSVILSFSSLFSWFGAIIMAKRYALPVSENFVYHRIAPSINSYISENLNIGSIVETLTSNLNQANNEILKFLLNLSPDTLETLVGLDSESAVSFLTENIGQTIAYGITYVVIFFLSYIVIGFAFKLLLKFVDITLKATFLSPLNKLLGAVLGGAVGALTCAMIIWTIMTVIPVTTTDGGMFSEPVIADTYVVKIIVNNKPNLDYIL